MTVPGAGGEYTVIAAGPLTVEDRPNHPLALRMGVIAGVSHNMIIGCLMGSFSVMLASVESRMGVTREMSSSVGALVIFGSAIIASFVGPLMARYSLRMLMFAGALLSVAGYLILAFTNSYPLYLVTYLALFGPSMAIAGSVGPATLVTRWFSRNRGLALGLVHLSLVVAVMPIACNYVLAHHGAQAVYLMMAALVGVALVPMTLAVRDFPPEPLAVPPGFEAAAAAADEAACGGPVPLGDEGIAAVAEAEARHLADGLTVPEILRSPAFWMLALAAGVIITAIMVMTFNMIPFAESLGVDRDRGALLQATMAFSGMAGSILFGWVADRIGGARGVALIAVSMGLLLLLLIFGNLPYGAVMVVIGLFGLCGAGMVPNVSRALATSLGQHSFSRAFGLQSALSVPLTAIGIWGMGASFTRTHSYSTAIVALAVAMLVVVPLALASGRMRARR